MVLCPSLRNVGGPGGVWWLCEPLRTQLSAPGPGWPHPLLLLTSAPQLQGRRSQEERSSWPLPSGILTRNYKHCFCLMTLSQNFILGPLWAAKWVTVQVRFRGFIAEGEAEEWILRDTHCSPPLSTHFYIRQLWNCELFWTPIALTHRGMEATWWKGLACHPSTSRFLRTSCDLLSHISTASAFTSYSSWMLLPHLPFSLQSLAAHQIINTDYTLCSSRLSLSSSFYYFIQGCFLFELTPKPQVVCSFAMAHKKEWQKGKGALGPWV